MKAWTTARKYLPLTTKRTAKIFIYSIITIVFCIIIIHIFFLAKNYIRTINHRLYRQDVPSYIDVLDYIKWVYAAIMSAVSCCDYYVKKDLLRAIFIEWQFVLALLVILFIYLLNELSYFWCM